MATAMAKVVAFLCLSLLVAQLAQVESARLLKQYEPVEATASTFPAEETPVDEIFTESTDVAEPVTTDTEYNYTALDTIETTPEDVATTEEATADEGVFATQETVVGETTPDSSVGDQSYVFDAQQDDETIEPSFTTSQGFEPLDTPVETQYPVEPVYDPSFAVQSTEFDLEEPAGEETSDPGAFAFDDSLPPPFGN